MPRRPASAKRPLKRRPSARAPRGAVAGRPSAVEAALASLAHEVRTPLTGILALAELLAASDLPERERAWASAVKGAAEHIAGLTTVVVDGARAHADTLTLQHAPFDPAALAETLAQAVLARAAVKGLSADILVAADLPRRALGDAVRLRAALENLVDNAVKFSEAGSVGFTAAVETEASGRLRLIFSVQDAGIGLSKPELRRLFRPFGQASRSIAQRFGGAGLGLAFARRIARAMRGDVTVESEAGRGSLFRLTVVVDPVEAGHEGAGTTPGAVSVRQRVLHLLAVEDNPYGRVVLNTMAAALGHRIDFAGTGAAAVEAVRTGAYDAVLMDVVLPDADGIAVTRRIRKLAGSAGTIPVIGLSGRSADEAQARSAGMNAYLVKPVSPSVLARALAAALGT
jgi:CheY-like chemotaxis protein/anti-sigma regulatory factor (Ser/Thr protein kinase)